MTERSEGREQFTATSVESEWSKALGTDVEIFTLEDALSWFDIATIFKDSVYFDMKKLGFINREHIKKLSDMELSKRIGYACENIGKIAKLYSEEVSTTHEIKQKIAMKLVEI